MLTSPRHSYWTRYQAIPDDIMVRKVGPRASSMAPGATRHKVQLQQKKKSYKVILEQVTEKKKKLLTLVRQAVAGT